MALSAGSRRLLRLQPFFQYVPAFGVSSSAAQLAEAPSPVPLKKLKDSFLDGTSSTYLEELEQRYQSDPQSVDKTWASFFRNLGKECEADEGGRFVVVWMIVSNTSGSGLACIVLYS